MTIEADITRMADVARQIYESIHDEAVRIAGSEEEAETLTLETLRDFMGHYRQVRSRRELATAV
ncbi:MAG: hypothetical protein HQK87_01635 [Nitrospinae bacterium]|nr:hypothetical protein [Nitrospinota bacterium]